LRPGDDVIGMIKLLVSKNPDADIAAIVALEGGFNPCANTSAAAATTGRRKRSTVAECDPGFVADDVNKYCYYAHYNLLPMRDSFDFCKAFNPDSELLYFENDNQVIGLLSMVSGGNTYY
jgi:hypothetical protein